MVGLVEARTPKTGRPKKKHLRHLPVLLTLNVLLKLIDPEFLAVNYVLDHIAN